MPSYVALGQRHEVQLLPLADWSQQPQAMMAGPAAVVRRLADSTPSLLQRIRGSSLLSSRAPDAAGLVVVQGAVPARASAGRRSAGRSVISSPAVMTLATPTVIAEGLRSADFAAARDFGAEILDEALDGKVLLRVNSVARAFELVQMLLSREVGSASPNFLRRVSHIKPSLAAQNWSLKKIGIEAAWAITRGSADVRVAVLDEGVDTAHAALKHAIVAERDFIGGKGASAMPDGDDAHGTACAGIVVSNDTAHPGIAPACGLIAARIAMGDGVGGWIFDDFATANAIDWCWREGASVLSNSWGGGAPSDAISRAFARARTQGRGGLGAVVAIAAGNAQQQIDFPGDLPGYVTVGASNPVDERKTRSSSDGEDWWGSNVGPSLHLLAPGVFIWTTDITGAAGYNPQGDFVRNYNGTSSATPAVAATAALMIAANPALTAASVRNLLAATAQPLAGQVGWTAELGWGRLNAGQAVQAARAQLGVAINAKPVVQAKKARGAPAPVRAAKKVPAPKSAARKAPKQSAHPGKSRAG
jgi:thermitase